MNSVKYTSEDVAGYYDEFTDAYLSTDCDFIQAFRPANTNDLMSYITGQLNLTQGTRLLDAGSGVSAASIWIARQFPSVSISCITNSFKQYNIACQKVKAGKLETRIKVTLGDYHQLTQYYDDAFFDRIIFLESLGHNHDLDKVLAGVNKVMAPGGMLYIKDFFYRKSLDQQQQHAINQVIKVIDDNYMYNTMYFPDLAKAINDNGLVIDQVKRPGINSDLNVTIAFEEKTQRLTYPHFLKTMSADWYEIFATKI